MPSDLLSISYHRRRRHGIVRARLVVLLGPPEHADAVFLDSGQRQSCGKERCLTLFHPFPRF